MVTEVVDPHDVRDRGRRDMLQIGAPQHAELRAAHSRGKWTVLLKRGPTRHWMSLLFAAEYLLHQGNGNGCSASAEFTRWTRLHYATLST